MYICREQLKIKIMNDFTNTGKKVKYENGNEFSVYSKSTKKGLRYYRYSSGRFFPLSKDIVNTL